MPETFVKVFSSILDSTVWIGTSPATKLVWITLLVKADKYGEVHGSIPGLAKLAEVSVGEAEQAIEFLCSPDPHSRTADHDGRRLEVIEGGWVVLNREKYRDMANAEDRREKARLRQQRKRKRDMSRQSVTERDKALLSQQAEAEAEAEAENQNTPHSPPSGGKPRPAKAVLEEEEFSSLKTNEAFMSSWERWISYRAERKKPMTAMTVRQQLRAALKAGPEKFQRAIERAIEKGWTGVFPEKEKETRTESTPSYHKPVELDDLYD